MRQRMPDGWVSIKWKDGLGHVWVSNVPTAIKKSIVKNIRKHHGKVIKIVR